MRMPARLSIFARADSGAVLTEFAIVLPLTLLVFGLIVESGRILWSYQSAVSGVRDASRYLSRVAPLDICVSGGSLAAFEAMLEDRIAETIGGNPAFPASVTLTGVSTSVTCVPGGYRIDPVPVAGITADVEVTFPFSGAMSFFGDLPDTFTAQVESRSRIFGL
ncbi:pilus assembly protein [Sulfitobacter sp. D35]|uniref:TadE/TadG family type IV pilus assembly protein n=1 Tax=Sulfitobacter sp. D35 TaxID=3083252 RepID=UPI00296E4AE7|nr:TadE family protein [Sulfitobacter sp. D35]MDW4499972.1 pilus assembly protein [Sulfitobacter sp. D35]